MQRLARWHQTRIGLGMFAVIELFLAYGFASLAIDKGSLWLYGATLLMLGGAIRNFGKLVRRLLNGNKPAEA